MRKLIKVYSILLVLTVIGFLYYMYIENIKLMIVYGINILFWQNNLFMLMKIKE